MESEHWRNVLVDWFNCLALVDVQIASVRDLENEVAFASLIQIIDKGSPAVTTEGKIDEILAFLQDAYPSLTISNWKEEDELILVSSYLLHHYFTRENVDFGNLEVQEHLQPKSYGEVKRFLEALETLSRKDVTKEAMREAIRMAEFEVAGGGTLDTVIESGVSSVTVTEDSVKQTNVFKDPRVEFEEKFDKKGLESKLQQLTAQYDSLMGEKKQCRENFKKLYAEMEAIGRDDIEDDVRQQREDLLTAQIDVLEEDLTQLQGKMNFLENEKARTLTKLDDVRRSYEIWNCNVTLLESPHTTQVTMMVHDTKKN